MKFYVLEVSDGDAKIAGKSVYEYETLDDAIASWHKKLGVAMGSAMYTKELCMVIDAAGTTYRSETFERVTE